MEPEPGAADFVVFLIFCSECDQFFPTGFGF